VVEGAVERLQKRRLTAPPGLIVSRILHLGFVLLQHAKATTDAWSERFARCAMEIVDDGVKG